MGLLGHMPPLLVVYVLGEKRGKELCNRGDSIRCMPPSTSEMWCNPEKLGVISEKAPSLVTARGGGSLVVAPRARIPVDDLKNWTGS